MGEKRILRPQPGPQEAFLASPADIVIYGGAAGGGKSYGLLLSPLRHKNVPGFGCTIFRRNFNQIFTVGGLWEEAQGMYQGIRGARRNISRHRWYFTDRQGNVISNIAFAYIERDDELENWQGSQICEIGFDELTHFSEKTFFFMLSRNRSKCGVTPFVRATCNPDADSWVKKFISWWLDEETGYPIPERSGVIRWFIRMEEQVHWADTKEELWERFNLVTPYDRMQPKSATFIASSVYDNKELLRVNPGYLANLKALPEVERERLLKGNWKIKAAAGLYFKRVQVRHYLPGPPADVTVWVRAWDLAATAEDEGGEPAYTAGVLMGKRADGSYVVADVINERLTANEVRQLVRQTAEKDQARYGKVVKIRIPQDPGQAGKDQAQNYIRFMSGFSIKAVIESGSKEARAEPVASQWQAGNIDLVLGDWNDMYLDQLESFPQSRYKDMVDATSNAFLELANGASEFGFTF